VANYNVDIGVKVRGEQLKKFGEQLKLTQKQVNGVNKFLDTFRKQNIRVNESITNLNAQLNKAKSTFQNATIGTKQQVQAAKDLIQANQNLNKGLVQQQKLLDDVSGSTAKKAAADNKKLQDGLLKLERQSTKEQEQKFLLRQQGEEQLRQKVKEINRERKEENRLIKQNVQQTKKSVAEEIKKKFSIIAAGTERRKNLRQSVRELEANRKQIPINDRINAQLRKRGLILSSNGKQIIRNTQNQNRRSGLGGGLNNAIGSGIIGGGFPLLFGQGPTAAIGGGIGGVAGGLIGGQFGFALSIAGTTIGSALDDLAKALAEPTENIGKLVQKFGLTGTATGDLALELEKLGLKSSAAKLLLEEGAEQFSLTADEIEINTKKMQDFENAINKLGTQITLFLADNLTPFIELLGKIPFGSIGKKLEPFANLIMFGQMESPSETVNKMKGISNIPTNEGEAIIGGVKLNPDFGKPGLGGAANSLKNTSNNLATQVFEQKELLPLKQKLELEKNRLLVSSNKLNLMKEEFELTNLDNELQLLINENEKISSDELDKKIQKLKIARDTQQQVVENTKALIDPFRQISDMIQIEMGNGIKDLIKGTRTLGDVLNNVLNKMIDGFLNLALFGNFGGGSITGGLLGAIFKADGGSVKAGGSYIVGERGPELFSPGVSGTITPNHAMGGTTSVVVNVDASGSSVEGDEAQGRELGRLISVAVQSEIVQQQRPGGLLA
jgi:hypothetical protein